MHRSGPTLAPCDLTDTNWDGAKLAYVGLVFPNILPLPSRSTEGLLIAAIEACRNVLAEFEPE